VEKKQAFENFMEQMALESGNVYCPTCSTPDWRIHHAPGKCPKDNSYASQATATVEKTETINDVIQQAETSRNQPGDPVGDPGHARNRNRAEEN
jgi:hypothetical protein